jgi:hypothetical protein
MPSGFLISSAGDLAHFLIAQLNGGRYGSTSILSSQGITAMQARGVPIGPGAGEYGLGWRTGTLGGVPAIFHAGDHPNAHTLLFFEPEKRRGAVLLLNSQNMLAQFGAFKEIEEGVARLLAEQELAQAASLSLRQLYLLVDSVLGLLLALTVWPVLRMRHWARQLRWAKMQRWWRLRVGLRLGWEFAVPVILLAAVRLVLYMLGAQSWAEGLSLFPDFGAWLWAISLLMLLTGVIRLVLLRRVLRGANDVQARGAMAEPTSQRTV